MKKNINLIIYFCFFVSGITGLIYEVLWSKYLILFIGATTYAHTIVLATFMGGLALGNHFLGSIADKVASKIKLYAWFELGIGIFCCATPLMLKILFNVFVTVAKTLPADSILLLALKLVISISIILIPTFLMGGTLPVLGRYFIKNLSKAGKHVALLYFINSIGAVTGCLFAGFYMIKTFGLEFSMIITAIVNTIIGLLAFVLSATETNEADIDDKNKQKIDIKAKSVEIIEETYKDSIKRLVIIGGGISGMAVMIYEVVWIRLLSIVLGSSTYSFSVMLAAFISGIALGSLLVTLLMSKIKNNFLVFSFLQIGIALSMILVLPFYERLPYYFWKFSSIFVRTEENFIYYQFGKFVLCFAVMFIPTLLSGMTLPLISHIVSDKINLIGKKIGSVFAWNTGGTLIGAILAGLIFLPKLGLQSTLDVGIIVNLLLGCFALYKSEKCSNLIKQITVILSVVVLLGYFVIIPNWNLNAITSCVFRTYEPPPHSYEEFKLLKSYRNVLFHKDGPNTSVTVVGYKDDKYKEKSLLVNGKPDASSVGDLPTQLLLGHLPMMLNGGDGDVMIVGFGSGITASAVLSYPEVKQLDLVEISPAVLEAAEFFKEENNDVVNNSRLNIQLEDAKTYFNMTDKKYDVVISEPSNPWIANVGGLFSKEFFNQVKDHLNKNGLMVQWFHLYELQDSDLELVLDTFKSVFKYVTVWNPMGSDIIIIGSANEQKADFSKMEQLLTIDSVRDDLKRIKIQNIITLLLTQMLSEKSVSFYFMGNNINSDYYPILEYQAPLGLFIANVSKQLHNLDERNSDISASNLKISEYLKDRNLTSKEYKSALNFISIKMYETDTIVQSLVDKWYSQYPEDENALVSLLKYSNESPRYKYEIIKKKIAEVPDNPVYIRYYYDILLALIDQYTSVLNQSVFEELKETYKMGLTHDGKYTRWYHEKMAIVEVKFGMFNESIEHLKIALQQKENENKENLSQDEINARIAELYYRLNNYQMVKVFLQKALEYNGANKRAMYLLRLINTPNN